MANNIRFKASLDDQVTGKLGKMRDQFDRLGKSKGAMTVLQGVGMGAGISAWGMLASGISQVTDFLADGVRGAIEEAKGIAQLDASLKANVKSWDGNRDAIERVIDKRKDLAFEDDALRASLSRLVATTKNVDKAFEIQTVAMDLARFKGIDLETATQALIKVEAGQYRALKDLGIVLREGATQTEALAAVQAVAMGQASAYMDTVAGKGELLQQRMDDLGEEIGSRLIPVLDDAATAVFSLGDALDALVNSEKRDYNTTVDLLRAISGFIPGGEAARQKLDALDKEVAENARKTNAAALSMDTFAESNAAARESVKALNPQLATMDKRLDNITGSAAAAAAKLDVVNRQAALFGNNPSSQEQRKKPGRAMGGYVAPGRTYNVGEAGMETLVMGANGGGYVLPNARGTSGGGGAPVVVQLNLDGREVARIVDKHLYYEAARAPRSSYAG